jgi:hypothetical protein
MLPIKLEIRLLIQLKYLSKNNKTYCEKWVDCFDVFGTNKEVIFCNVLKAIKSFISICVTTCSCEKLFSKLSIVKTKFISAMLQKRLDNLLSMFIEQELAYNFNLDGVIETFNIIKSTKRCTELQNMYDNVNNKNNLLLNF